MHPKQKQKLEQKKQAKETLMQLFQIAEQNFSKNKQKSDKCAKQIRKLQLKFKIKLPAEIKRRICKKCDKFLKPGENCKIRTKDGKLIIHCLECKNIFRMPYKPKKKTIKKQKVKD